MADILLINPIINPASQNSVINRIMNKTFPTSLGVLAGFLRNHGGYDVCIVDEQIDFLDRAKLRQMILSLNEPRIIGLSVLTLNSKRAYQLSVTIKEIDSNATIVIGGIHPSVLPEESLSYRSIDVVVRGEGEETFKELVDHICSSTDYSGIPGLSYRKKDSIKHNPDRPLIKDLDSIPPFPYEYFLKDKDNYPSFGTIFTSRGCPYNCIFCSSRSISGKQYRYFSIERVISEIRLLVDKYNQKTIWMMDDNIAARPKHFIELLDAIIAAGLHNGVNYHGSMRGDNISESVLDKAKDCNFQMIAFGLETASEPLMSLIQKGETVNQVADAIRLTDKTGIATATTIIFGLPTETRKDRWDAIRLVRSLPLSSVRFNTLTPYPGTPAFKMLSPTGKIHIKKDWGNFAVQYLWEGDDIPYVPESSDRYELMFDTMYANLSFYLSPKGMIRMLKSSFAGGYVVSLEKAWYLSPKTLWGFFRVFLYLTKRFTYVTYKMLFSRLHHRFFRMKNTGRAIRIGQEPSVTPTADIKRSQIT